MADTQTDALWHLRRALELLDLEPCGIAACHVQHAIDILAAERADLDVRR